MDGLPPPGQSAWKEAKTPEGKVYYFKPGTQETTWEKPPDYDVSQAGCPALETGLTPFAAYSCQWVLEGIRQRGKTLLAQLRDERDYVDHARSYCRQAEGGSREPGLTTPCDVSLNTNQLFSCADFTAQPLPLTHGLLVPRPIYRSSDATVSVRLTSQTDPLPHSGRRPKSYSQIPRMRKRPSRAS
jgi:hypothetical protein